MKKKKRNEWQISPSSAHLGLLTSTRIWKKYICNYSETLFHTQAAVSWITSPYLPLLRAAVLPSLLSMIVCSSSLVCAGISARAAAQLDWKLIWLQKRRFFFLAKAAPWTDKPCADTEGGSNEWLGDKGEWGTNSFSDPSDLNRLKSIMKPLPQPYPHWPGDPFLSLVGESIFAQTDG